MQTSWSHTQTSRSTHHLAAGLWDQLAARVGVQYCCALCCRRTSLLCYDQRWGTAAQRRARPAALSSFILRALIMLLMLRGLAACALPRHRCPRHALRKLASRPLRVMRP